jgi:hypothetical protein
MAIQVLRPGTRALQKLDAYVIWIPSARTVILRMTGFEFLLIVGSQRLSMLRMTGALDGHGKLGIYVIPVGSACKSSIWAYNRRGYHRVQFCKNRRNILSCQKSTSRERFHAGEPFQ